MLNPLPSFTIDAVGTDDLNQIDRIEQQAFSTPWSRDLLRAAIVNGTYRVRALRTDVDGLAGFYIAHTVRGRSNLDNLAVDTHLRNAGYGSELIVDWIEHSRAERLDALTLQVNTANVRAQGLYERFQFKTVRLLVSYYPNGDDAYQMERVIAEAPPLTPAPGSRRYWLRARKRGLLARR